MLSLVLYENSAGGRFIFIQYGFMGANDLMDAAFNAIVLEEQINAASNTDGL